MQSCPLQTVLKCVGWSVLINEKATGKSWKFEWFGELATEDVFNDRFDKDSCKKVAEDGYLLDCCFKMCKK